ncbi:hypothetical protein QYS49_20125 [Marivirga salinae]|uniref:Uncharacterized protein n=1 Tax=Marivirga salinarum TaxID=3059078 RepID=A0AA49GBG1_9BACT|nr:hypothetical protein [Marivirga sp. BDSF4-3]WKK74105.2 hypothetical protein QYS49_20125 [Marivirga sp. BDSF4-3]
MKKLNLSLILIVIFFMPVFAQDINIGIKSIDIPDYPRGDYVPFSNCPRSQVTKFQFRVENRGENFNKAGKPQFGSVQIKRLSDGEVLLKEEAVYDFKGFTTGWMNFRFAPIDLSQPGLYEITVESYLIDLETYKKDRSLIPIDSDMSDNKVTYLNRVFDPETLEKDKTYAFNFDDIESKKDLTQQGWNYSYLPDSLKITEKGIDGSKAVVMNLPKGKNERKLFTPPVSVTNGIEIDFEFKLIDAKSGKNVTEELMVSEGFNAKVSFQDICSTGVKVTSTYSVAGARATKDGFFNFPFKLKYQTEGVYRAQIEFSNMSNYKDLLLVIDNIKMGPKD